MDFTAFSIGVLIGTDATAIYIVCVRGGVVFVAGCHLKPHGQKGQKSFSHL